MNSERRPAKEDSGDPVENSNVMDMEPMEFENDPVSPSILKVFQNDMLLDMIVGRSITSESVTRMNDTKVYLTGVGSLRLVNRAWLQSVSRVMTKKKIPLFTFHLSRDKDADFQKWEFKRKYYEETRQQTYCFLNTDDDSPPLSIHWPIPPFKLDINLNDSIEDEGYRLIRNCFLDFGSGLVNLRLEVDGLQFGVGALQSEGTLPINLDLPETLSLRNLRTLHIGQDPESTSPTRTEQLFMLVHSILRAAESLKFFEIEANFKIEVSPNCSISFNLPFIPASLRQLTVDLGEIGSTELEEFLGSRPIPNLTQLKLKYIPGERDNVYLEDGTLFMILDNLKDNLKIFEIEASDEDLYEELHMRTRSILRFPVMKKLKKLKICTELVELEPGQAPLQRFIPNVRYLELTHQTEEMLQRWMEGSEYPAVKTLVVDTVIEDDDDAEEDHWREYIQGINHEVSGWIHSSFPNVTKLKVIVLPSEASGLKMIFERMTQLTSLHIEVRGTFLDDDHPFFMDSALTGLPSQMVSRLTEDPELCDGIEIKRGICKLKNLKSLCLEHRPGDYHRIGDSLSLELTFSSALRNLPKLETVRLLGSDQLFMAGFRSREEEAE